MQVMRALKGPGPVPTPELTNAGSKGLKIRTPPVGSTLPDSLAPPPGNPPTTPAWVPLDEGCISEDTGLLYESPRLFKTVSEPSQGTFFLTSYADNLSPPITRVEFSLVPRVN
jgi:hypothetical protein